MSAASVAVVATSGERHEGWCCLQVKLCDQCLSALYVSYSWSLTSLFSTNMAISETSALYVPWCEKALYKYSSFPFLYLFGVALQSFDQATVMFSTLIGFTEQCARCSPATLAVAVNSVFDVFDRIVDCHNVFKARLAVYYLRQGGCVFVVVCLFVCLLATLRKKTSKRICTKFSRKVGNGPTNK